MREGQEEAKDSTEPEDYVPPALTDLGAFEDITKFNPQGTGNDSEGFSIGTT